MSNDERPGTGTSHHEIAAELAQQGNFQEAEALLRRVMEEQERSLGMLHPAWAATAQDLSAMLSNQGRHDEAVQYLRKTLAVLEEAQGKDSPQLASTLQGLGTLAGRAGDHGEAEVYFRRSLHITGTQFDGVQALVGPSLANLAQCLAAQGNPAAADVAKQALYVFRETFGEDHPFIREQQTVLEMIRNDPPQGDASVFEIQAAIREGQAALAAGAAERAEQHLDVALGLARKREDEVAEAAACGYLAETYLALGRREEARARAARALEIAEARGDERPAKQFRNLLAAADASEQEYAFSQAFRRGHELMDAEVAAVAIPHLEKATELAKALQDEVHEAFAGGLLAQALLAEGRREEAKIHAQRAVDISEAHQQEGAIAHFRSVLLACEMSDDEAQLQGSLGKAWNALRTNEAEESLPWLERALALAEKLERPADVATAHGMWAEACIALERIDEALAHAEKALAIAGETGAKDAATHFQSLLDLARAVPEERELARHWNAGQAVLQVGRYGEAIASLEKGLALAEALGKERPEVAFRGALAQAFLATGRTADAKAQAAAAKAIAEKLGDDALARQLQGVIEATAASPEQLAFGNELQAGRAAHEAGSYAEAATHLSRAVELAVSAGQQAPEAGARGMLAQSLHALGRKEAAIEEVRKAAAIAEARGDKEPAAQFHALLHELSTRPAGD